MQAGSTLRGSATLVHEYAHFLHNFSTVVGFYDLIAQFRTSRVFLETVNAAGECKATADHLLEELCQFRTHCSGQSFPPLQYVKNRPDLEMTFNDTKSIERQINLGNTSQRFTSVRLEITVNQGPHASEKSHFELGSIALMEGIAWEFERIIFENAGADPIELDKGLPTFPYKVCRAFFEKSTGRTPTPSQLSRIILLALQSTDCGFAFLELTGAVADRPDADLDQIIDEKAVAMIHYLRPRMPKLLESIDSELGQFGTTTRLAKVIGSFVEMAKKYLAMRVNEPFFELAVLEKKKGFEENANSLFRAFGACPILSEKTPGIRELVLVGDNRTDEEIAAWGVSVCFQDFTARHIAPGATFRGTATVPHKPCQFFGACGAQFATDHPEICTTMPWKSFDPDQKEGCWYSQAVKSAVDLGNLARSTKPDQP